MLKTNCCEESVDAEIPVLSLEEFEACNDASQERTQGRSSYRMHPKALSGRHLPRGGKNGTPRKDSPTCDSGTTQTLSTRIIDPKALLRTSAFFHRNQDASNFDRDLVHRRPIDSTICFLACTLNRVLACRVLIPVRRPVSVSESS